MRPLLVPCLALALALAQPLARPAMAQDADGTAIQTVIEDQIGAFQRGDLDAAFAHASPSIQGKFGSAGRFGHMVEHGYPMIWAPERYAMGALADSPHGPVQTVTFVDDTGEVWEADYLMREVDGRWRINGVRLRRLPGVAS
ncbi:MAG: DUF4864 domain-containing protein [Paracoccaceae bacterium]